MSHEIMSEKSTLIRKLIIEAIDDVKSRRSRPAQQRIVELVTKTLAESNDHLITEEIVLSELSAAVNDGSVMKVKYKNGISYRNPAAMSNGGSKITCPEETGSDDELSNQELMVLSAAQTLSSSCGQNVTALAIFEYLTENNDKLNCDLPGIQTILDQGVNLGLYSLATNGSYVVLREKQVSIDQRDLVINSSPVDQSLMDVDIIQPVKRRPGRRKKAVQSPDSGHSTSSSSSLPNSSQDKPDVNEGSQRRPVSQRKKIKKSLGPDFLDPFDNGYQNLKSAYEPKCSVCNGNGPRKDDLVPCSKCSQLVHLHCLDCNQLNLVNGKNNSLTCKSCRPKCSTCDQAQEDKSNPLMTCIDCDSAFHVNCLGSVLNLDASNWRCVDCLECFNESELKNHIPNGDDVGAGNSEVVGASMKHVADVFMAALAKSKVEAVINDGSEASAFSKKNPSMWSVGDVCDFIRTVGFEEESEMFKDQEIDGKSLLLLKRDDVLSGIKMKLGPALKIYSLINHLQHK